jgi:hypothetical protein
MPTYFVDYDDNSNWARIGALKPDGSCRVMVRQEENPTAPSVPANGTRKENGDFILTVSNAEASETIDLTYSEVMETLDVYRAQRHTNP